MDNQTVAVEPAAQQYSDFFTIDIQDGIATVWLNLKNEKQNVVSPALIPVFNEMADIVENDDNIKAVVFISGKKAFIAGADIKSFKIEKKGDFQPFLKTGHKLLNRLEKSKKPYVAAIHGTCYGLGVEMSLACAARIATKHRSTKLALPEVKLGLLPGGGGTQRLPRLVGVQKALDMMLTGKNIYSRPALKMGLVDELTEPVKLHQAAINLAKRLINKPLERRNKKSLFNRFLDNSTIGNKFVFREARKTAAKVTQGNYPAVPRIIDCVEIGLTKGMKAGLKAERKYFEELMLTNASKALISIFHTMTATKKVPNESGVQEVDTLGIIGGGFMGAGIAEVSANNNIDVLLKDIQESTLEKAKQGIWKGLNKKVKYKTLTPTEAANTVNRVKTQLSYKDFQKADIVIEAVVEKMSLKKVILKEVEEHCKEDVIFATNTSSLSVTELANHAKNPKNVIGMHYFSPVPKMPLLEIVKTDRTADWVINTCFEVGIRQGKTCIVVKDSPGFYVNRILAPYLNECMLLLEEGGEIDFIDKQLKKLGFPVGPFALMDEVGIDIGAHIMQGDLMDSVQEREGITVSQGLPRMFNADFLGRKNKKGFYLYHPKTGKKQKVNQEAYQFFGAGNRQKLDAKMVQNRPFMLMLNEALMCLEEGIIESPTDGDVGAIFGIGFLPFTGGPFRYIDAVGAQKVIRNMQNLADTYGPKFQPAAILYDYANNNKKFHS